MKILRLKDDICLLWDLIRWFRDKDLSTGDRFAISWKVGKRREQAESDELAQQLQGYARI